MNLFERNMPASIGCYIVGAVFLGIGLPLGISFPYIFSALLQQQLHLSDGSILFAEWKESPVPIYMDVYMWNWTNAEEFVNDPKITPHFNEVGPFVFKVETQRANVTWNDNDTVTYAPNRTYYFQPELSGDIKTLITNYSPIPAVIAYFARLWPSLFFLEVMNHELEIRENLYITETVENWLFNGINDTLFDLIVPIKNIVELPMPYDKFAWFYGRNHSVTAEGVLTINTGAEDLSDLGRLVLWQGSNRTAGFKEHCGEIGGYTGELLPPMDVKPEAIPLFAPDICSQLSLTWSSETDVHGVTGWKFVGSRETLDDGSNYPENACFCNGECIPAGLRNISACKFGAPAFVSFPHFYLANHSISEQVKGMYPEQSMHEFSLKVEPTTGVPLSVQASLQINLLMRPLSHFTLFNDLPEVYMPMIWFQERAEITPELASMLYWVVLIPTIGPAVLYSLAAIGVLMLCYNVFGRFINKKNRYSVKIGKK